MMLFMKVHVLQDMYTKYNTMASVQKQKITKQKYNPTLCAVICSLLLFPIVSSRGTAVKTIVYLGSILLCVRKSGVNYVIKKYSS